jgi:hypothetical protein
MAVDYTWQTAHGNASDPRETANLAENGQDPRPAKVPLNWDQRHTLNFTVSVARPGSFATNAVLRLGTGQPYTPELRASDDELERNSGRKPLAALLDLRGEKSFKPAGLDASVFLRVFNALDTRFFNGFVFASSGSPDYTKTPARDAVQLADPTRYYGPRRIELGFTLRSGG